MKNECEIAVVVPVYNPGRVKLKACIKSILRQTFTNFTLVLVDDGSTDESGKICDAYAEKDTRVAVIHQPNKGSVSARKMGVFSEAAQHSKYIFFCDSDDVIPKDALEKLISAAQKTKADCACGNTNSIYRKIVLPNRFVPPVFADGKTKVYTNQMILSELYVSCFGISNFPVSLCAKLYKTELISEATKNEPLVRFMGNDLSVTLNVLPKTQRLVIIPDIVYGYRIGGGTSKFMPYMLEDFLLLYRFKQKMSREYPMPQRVEYLMAVEMSNVLISWLQMCALQGGYDKKALLQEASRVCMIPDVQRAVRQEDFVKERPDGVRKAIQDGNSEELCAIVYERIKAGRLRRFVKSLMK